MQEKIRIRIKKTKTSFLIILLLPNFLEEPKIFLFLRINLILAENKKGGYWINPHRP
jgi:hypothetical protein